MARTEAIVPVRLENESTRSGSGGNGNDNELDRFDDIIARIEKLRFSRNIEKKPQQGYSYESKASAKKEAARSQLKLNIVESTADVDKGKDHEDHEDKEDNEFEEGLLERGPIREFHNPARSLPYSTVDFSAIGFAATSNTIDVLDSIDSTAEKILRHKEYKEKLAPCLDKLSNGGLERGNGEVAPAAGFNNNSSSSSSSNFSAFNGADISPDDAAALPSIIVDDPEEDSLLEMLARGTFQPAQLPSEAPYSPAASSSSNCNSSVATGPCSRSNSRASSYAQSPPPSAPANNLFSSPHGSPQIVSGYRVPPGLSSSSSSSNQSYCDTPSPASCHQSTPANQRVEDYLGWRSTYDSSSTLVNSKETVEESIDSSELQLVLQVLRDLDGKYERYNGDCSAQVVPADNNGSSEGQRASCSPKSNGEIVGAMSGCTDAFSNAFTSAFSSAFSNAFSGTARVDEYHAGEHRDYYELSLGNVLEYTQQFTDAHRGDNANRGGGLPETKSDAPAAFVGFQIPETVSNFRSGRSRRNSERSIVPWPSLNLPSTKASERLIEVADPLEMRKAMTDLLKKSVEVLARQDEDGDTELMCLVGNPEELAQKMAYLAPLVDRLGTVPGKLFVKNNRGEDALYLAAINCPHMSYVAGYLAAAILQRGIDISQRLYHTRGDTLIHSVAARGDSHSQVLAELLALRTLQGNGVFDLSKCNYDGRTALHVAVESHDPTGRGVKSIGTVRLLLDNGADPKIREPKCGDTALHMAVSLSCDPQLVKVLLEKKGSEAVNLVNYLSNTALHVACASSRNTTLERQTEVCWLLIHAGAQTNIQNRQGKTPLALVSPERKEVIRKIFYKK